MSFDATKALTLLVFQYGPFAFSILFLFGISRWAYKRYDEAGKRTPAANPDQIKTARDVYIVSFATGIVLVGISVWWFWTHRPLYVVTGTISNVDHNLRISSVALYFRDRPHPQVSENDVPLHDVEFVAVSDKPFTRGHRFPVELSKNAAPRDQVQIEYDPNDSDNEFSTDFKDGKNILVCNSRHVQHHQGALFQWLSPSSVHAQEIVPPQQPTSEITKPTNRKASSLRAAPKQNHISQQNPEPDQSITDVLNDPHANVGTKIVALEKLSNASPTELVSYLQTTVDGEPFAATVVDLTRHSDPELAYEARLVLKNSNFDSYLQKELTAPDGQERKNAQIVLNHLEPEQASALLRELPTKETGKIQPKNLALAPTNFPDGDRYYMQIKWNSSNQAALGCLSKFFSSSLDAGQSPEMELATMRARGERLVYSAYKSWVSVAAEQIRECGGSVSFVRPGRSLASSK